MTDDQLAAWRAAVAARNRAKRTRRGRRRNPYRNAQPARLMLPPTHRRSRAHRVTPRLFRDPPPTMTLRQSISLSPCIRDATSRPKVQNVRLP
jgi:hypothetical protein